ncbi:GNAT family N-acetyltransferase [Sinorhizobium meliloti]|uniref:GNAT family N-acetyltransferase n=2 Tax=Rhizobium meliloti TaxID=382 RepID=UPI000FD78423|nr:GNAT family N-acetyltransferase [Sinorhizobium meliloti]RVP95708.1 GNAT family N-acetyltransferase [Sinorhizobium meliloti]
MKTPSQKNDQPTPEGPYCIRFYKHYADSPAWELVPQALTYLEESGFAIGRGPQTPPLFTDSCMAAIGKDGKAIGFLTCDCDGESWYISLSYVVPEHRRKYIHTALFDALRNKAKEQGNVDSITCSTHANNLAAQAAFEAQGRTKESITYTYWLKDGSDGKEPTESAAAQSPGRGFEEMRMPEYLVESFDTGLDGPKSMQAFINEKAAEGYSLHQAIERSPCQWVLIFSSLSCGQCQAT